MPSAGGDGADAQHNSDANVKYRLIERNWETNDRRRYAVERLAAVNDGEEHWSLERFFGNVLGHASAQRHRFMSCRQPSVRDMAHTPSNGEPKCRRFIHEHQS
jgi:hypothetical protein